MAGFGGSVKLTGESEYRKALNQITNDLKTMSSALKSQTSDFNSNDKSIKNTASAQKQLNDTIKQQQQAVNVAKSSLSAYSVEMQKQTTLHNQLNKEYKNAVLELDRIKKTSGETSDEYKKQAEAVDKLEKELIDSQIKLDENKSAMASLKTEINNSNKTINEASKKLDELGNEAEESGEKAKKGSEGFTVFKGILANLGSQAITSAINGIKKLGSAFVSLSKEAISSYADYEQLVGGVETLFKDSSPIVQEYARNAYKTAGMSANEYMETVTSFSASLLQSLGGDTEKAAKYGDMAISDMSDNANKMGTSMESIQNAYQGFAKQNYTMLDNLKLGYGGTKTEMERLLKDAEKFSGQKYDIKNLSDVYEAIHVVQQEMGITGTTAKEASQTIQGSTAAMKSAWKNLLTGMADDNADFDQLINNFVGSVLTVGDNIIPRIKTVITGVSKMVSGLLKELVPKLVQEIPPLLQETLPILLDAVSTSLQAIIEVLPMIIDAISQLIPQIVQTLLTMLPQLVDVGIKGILSLIQGLSDAIPQLVAMLPTIIKQIVDTLIQNLPLIIETGVQVLLALINGLTEAIPELIDYLPTLIETIVTVLIENLPLIIDAAIQIMLALINGLITSIPKLVAAIPKIIIAIVKGLIEGLPKFIENGGKIISSLITGIGNMLGNLGVEAGKIVTTIVDKIKGLPGEMLKWGKDMMQGLADGIKGAVNKVKDAAKGIGEKIKNFLHFSRPDEGPLRDYETWMPDMVKGLSTSLEKSAPTLIGQIKALSDEMENAMQPNLALNGSDLNEINSSNINTQSNFNSLVEAFKTALEDMKIELDNEQMGKFVDKTVAYAIFN